jgi:hypothetical protein
MLNSDCPNLTVRLTQAVLTTVTTNELISCRRSTALDIKTVQGDIDLETDNIIAGRQQQLILRQECENLDMFHTRGILSTTNNDGVLTRPGTTEI